MSHQTIPRFVLTKHLDVKQIIRSTRWKRSPEFVTPNRVVEVTEIRVF